MEFFVILEGSRYSSDEFVVWNDAYKTLKEAKDEVYNCEVEFLKDCEGNDYDIKMLDDLDFEWKDDDPMRCTCHPSGDFDTAVYTITKVKVGE